MPKIIFTRILKKFVLNRIVKYRSHKSFLKKKLLWVTIYFNYYYYYFLNSKFLPISII